MARTKDRRPKLIGMNAKRAAWAMAAVRRFQEKTGLSNHDGIDAAIVDLIADLHHLCDKHGFDFGSLVDKAGRYYEEETFAVCRKCRRPFDLAVGDGREIGFERYQCKECA